MNQGFFIAFGSYFKTLNYIGLNFPYLAKSVGNINKLRIVEVNKPPTMIDAIGPSISLPGSPLPKIRGSNPKPVTIAVIKIDGNLSEAPLAAVAKFHTRFSFCTKC